ncbi:hypothetical protein WHR41_05002 [Cladosporium halotolerans]|uniref:Uncharacterized protein n=1 Tax=Cladosporium halotolerans TaxID=1052096 RepID=A0AB34KM88_9PEZI
MAQHRPRRNRRRTWEGTDTPITIRVGSRRHPRGSSEIQVTCAQDGSRLARLIDEQTCLRPKDPLIVSINGHQPWLKDILCTCFDASWEPISEVSRELQFAETAKFPERASKSGQSVPWTFIMDQMNVPQVYFWSVGLEPPENHRRGIPIIQQYRLRVGVWFCEKGACKFNRSISTTLIFTRPCDVPEHIVSNILFKELYGEDDFNQPRDDPEGICWIFSRLYWLLSNWQNVIREVIARLDEAEINSSGRYFPVKLRTRTMHIEVDRIYELQEYLRFHSRSFRKLAKLRQSVSQDRQEHHLWNEIEDTVDDLDQFDSSLDNLKERFLNLLDLEFNIQNADQSEDSSFLAVIATLFLPVSFLASIFGIQNIEWRPVWYLWSAVPIFVASCIFVVVFPFSVRRYQKTRYGLEATKVLLRPTDFTMLGDALPDSVNVPGSNRLGRLKDRAQRQSIGEDVTHGGSRSRSRGWA